jgi:hypothetical protein
MDSSVRASLARLFAVTTDLETEARRQLAKIAHPETRFWRAEYVKFIERYDGDLRAVRIFLWKQIAEATASRRQLEALHDETLAREIESQLIAAVAAQADAVRSLPP